MDIKVVVLAAAVAMILLVLAFASQTPKPPQSSYSYIEIVSSKAGEDGYSLEYIVASDGLVFKKEGIYPKEPKIGVSITTKEQAALIISTWPYDLKSRDSINCQNCEVYHLFYHDGKKTLRYNIEKNQDNGLLADLIFKAEEAYNSAEKKTPFFIQQVYVKGAFTRDFHFFENGLVIREDFGPGEGEITDAAVFKIEASAYDLVKSEVFSNNQNQGSCRKYDYGYLEIKKDNNYVFAFTCGEGSGPADLLYSGLLKLVEK